MTKKWYQSTTIWINVLLGFSSVAGIVASFLEAGDFSTPALIGLIFATINVLNRLRTTDRVTF